MGIETDADRDSMLDPDVFGVQVTYNGTTAINVIFNDAYEAANPATGEVETTYPNVLAKTSDIAGAKHRDTFLINGKTYEVIKIQPDGEGMTLLSLTEQTNG